MNFIEAARKVVETSTCHLLRRRKGGEGFDAKPYHGAGNKRGWFYLDLFSSSAVVSVFDALNEANKAKLAAICEADPVKGLSIALKLCK